MENKLKSLFVCRGFQIGGIEVSSVAFINNMYNQLDLDVFAFSNSGKLMDQLPKDIRLFHGNKFAHLLYQDRQSYGAGEAKSKKFKFKVFVKTLLRKLGFKEILKMLCFVGQKKFKNYDVSICFDGMDLRCAKMALKKVEAKAKICFIHCDTEFVVPSKTILKHLNKFDRIYCVSESCAKKLRKYFDDEETKNKIGFIYNFQNIEKIKTGADKFNIEFDKTKINFISVSRLSPEKAYVRSLRILKKLQNEGFDNYIWHILGEGQCMNEIRQFIAENKMSEYVKLYGNQINPYPYIKAADLFWLGSYHEAAPMVYAESKILGTPILSTKTCSAEELVGDYGVICDNDEENIYQMFLKILKNGKKNLIVREPVDFDNNAIKEKLLNELQTIVI